MRKYYIAILVVSFTSLFATVIMSAWFVARSKNHVEIAPMPRIVLSNEDYPVQDMDWETLWKNSKHNKDIFVNLIMQFDGMDCHRDNIADVYIVDRKVKFKIGEINFQNLPRITSEKKGSGITFPEWYFQDTYSHQDFVLYLSDELSKFDKPPFPTSKILILGRNGKEIAPLKIETKTSIFYNLMD